MKLVKREDLNKSQISEMDKMDLPKIKEAIILLENMQERSVQANKFVEAELCKQRIEAFKKKEKEKIYEELLNRQKEDREQLDIEKKEELDQFNEKWDIDYFKLRDKFEKIETQIREQQLKEFDDKREEVEAELASLIPKPSSEAINLNCILENMIKQKEFSKAHDVQIQLTNIVKADQERIKNENQKKIQAEINRISTKHENELNAFKLKMKLAFDEYKKSRAIEYDNLVQKYKNRIKDLDNSQKKELALFPKNVNLDKIMNRNSSKISNILKEEE
eukprot:CAMPEP_0170517370 /NCGR_PEP_ID=MMETSP0209-20121228/3386_1 /TAXON_ID=665100 ORGANISM="Litonotus pictus, Strain P1" /NCGR_SAMPLE_ID=MMETSP0209 /ASSEMBLY_ACC=CAM_ASM_000301 /LENGTH=276 /DNA_ID=CAMNT_0010802601 /DNA_START=1 /DNA_END=831 /DNA_ORIENTATION=+